MSLFAILAWDRPGAHDTRMATRDAHFSHVERVIDSIAVAGPLRTADGGFAGSILIVKAGGVDEALAMLEADPYFQAGIWERWEIHPFVAAAGEWVGGRIW